jgi:hypothetical protein
LSTHQRPATARSHAPKSGKQSFTGNAANIMAKQFEQGYFEQLSLAPIVIEVLGRSYD